MSDINKYTYIFTYTHIDIHIHIHIHTHIHLHLQLYTHIHINYTYTLTYTHAHTYTYMYKYAYTYTYTYTYAYTGFLSWWPEPLHSSCIAQLCRELYWTMMVTHRMLLAGHCHGRVAPQCVCSCSLPLALANNNRWVDWVQIADPKQNCYWIAFWQPCLCQNLSPSGWMWM